MSARAVNRGGNARKGAGRGRQARVDHKRANKLAALAFGGFVLAIAAVAIVALDLPAKAATAAGEAVGSAGFTVKRVDVKGIKRMDSKPVYDIAFDQQSMAMPLVDVAAVRAKLLRFGWVKDARVSRRLPDTLVIDIVERQPAAMWQDQQRLALIDAEGVVLDRVRVDQMPDLPLLIGPGANDKTDLLDRLLSGVPTLKPQLASATWIGRRRWDLAFQSGETVALPEGETAARTALAKFAKIDRASGLLGRGLVRFDLRVPGKMIVRLPRAPGESIALEPSADG
jgi:cell division protein FtsQ